MKGEPCVECGRPNNRGGRLCARCYGKRYRGTATGKRRHNDAVVRYNARNPDKHRTWSRRWKQRVGLLVPDLAAVRSATKRLEQALAYADERAGVRESGELGGDQGLEWDDGH